MNVDYTALGVVALLITTVAGVVTQVLQNRQIHREVKSPNGSTTGESVGQLSREIHAIHVDLRELRHDQAALAVELGNHLRTHDRAL